MGRLAQVALGRDDLPSRCLIFAGVYSPRRANVVKKHFDTWTRPNGDWVKYAYAKKGNREYLVCFNVYGAATTLELLHLLKDGEARCVFFIGSMGSNRLEIGTIVLPDRVVDRAGIVSLDTPKNPEVRVNTVSIAGTEAVLRDRKVPFVKGKTASVPSVLHDLKRVKRFLSASKDILGVELELSTFHHFGRKLGLKTYGLLYVWDNPKHDIISGPGEVWKARMNALGQATSVALATLWP